MSKTRRNQQGFSVVEIIIVIVVLALIGLVACIVYKDHHKSAGSVATDSTSAAQSYAGWQSYCDTIQNGCFKYPGDWTLTSSTTYGFEHTKVFNPSKTASATYQSIIAAVGSSQSGAGFYAVSTNSLSTSTPKLKIVGGYFTSSNIPCYYIVNASALTTYPLTAGKASQFEALPDYDLKNSTNFGTFAVCATQKGVGSAAQAKAWYSTSNGKDALLIVQSFYYQ